MSLAQDQRASTLLQLRKGEGRRLPSTEFLPLSPHGRSFWPVALQGACEASQEAIADLTDKLITNAGEAARALARARTDEFKAWVLDKDLRAVGARHKYTEDKAKSDFEINVGGSRTRSRVELMNEKAKSWAKT